MWASGLRVLGLGFRVLGFRVQGLGLGACSNCLVSTLEQEQNPTRMLRRRCFATLAFIREARTPQKKSVSVSRYSNLQSLNRT